MKYILLFLILIIILFIIYNFTPYKVGVSNDNWTKEGFTPTIRRSYHSNLRKFKEKFNNNILNSDLVKSFQKKTNKLLKW